MHLPGYEILAHIGSGGSGDVFRARQLSLGREVALKLIGRGLFDEEQTRARFLREAKLQAKLSHPNLVAVYDAGLSGDRLYLALELVEGPTLQELIDQRGKLTASETLRLARQIASGMAAAHELGIVHRDLKPENVLLTRSGDAKVSDFGLARPINRDPTWVTNAGDILGTPGYVAPEVLLGSPVSPASDVYATGAVLYEMLTGVMWARDPKRQMGALEPIVRKCLSESPRERFRDCGQLLGALEPQPSPKPAPRSRVWWPLAVAGLVVTALLVTIPRARPQVRTAAIQVAAGSDCARLELAPAPAVPARVWCRAGDHQVEAKVPVGSPAVLVQGLRPSTKYALRYEAGELRIEKDFVTLARSSDGRATVLAPRRPRWATPRLSVWDRHAVAVWHEEDEHRVASRAYLCESQDAGATWSQPRLLETSSVEAVVARTSGYTLVLSSASKPLEIWSRAEDGWRRIRPVDRSGGWLPHVTSRVNAPLLDVLLTDGAKLSLARLDPAGPSADFLPLPDWSDTGLQPLREIVTDGRSVAMAGSATSAIWVARAEAGGPSWHLQGPHEGDRLHEPRLLLRDGRTIVAYATRSGDRLQIFVHREGDGAARELLELPGHAERAQILQFVTENDALYLVCVIRVMFTLVQPVIVMRLDPDGEWRKTASDAVPYDIHRALAIAQTGPGELLALMKSDTEGVLVRRFALEDR